MHNKSVLKIVGLAMLSIGSGIVTGFLICPLLNYLMGSIPVPYEWISGFEIQWRLPIFLFGAYLLFLYASLVTVGVSAVVIGYSCKSFLWLPVILVFTSSATTYCCFILDSHIFSHFNHWISLPTSWLYMAELVSLLLLITFMIRLGAWIHDIREFGPNINRV